MQCNIAITIIVSRFIVNHIHFQLFCDAYDPQKMKRMSFPCGRYDPSATCLEESCHVESVVFALLLLPGTLHDIVIPHFIVFAVRHPTPPSNANLPS